MHSGMDLIERQSFRRLGSLSANRRSGNQGGKQEAANGYYKKKETRFISPRKTLGGIRKTGYTSPLLTFTVGEVEPGKTS